MGYFKIGNIFSIDRIFEMASDPLLDPALRRKMEAYKKQFLKDAKHTRDKMKKQARIKNENKL